MELHVTLLIILRSIFRDFFSKDFHAKCTCLNLHGFYGPIVPNKLIAAASTKETVSSFDLTVFTIKCLTSLIAFLLGGFSFSFTFCSHFYVL